MTMTRRTEIFHIGLILYLFSFFSFTIAAFAPFTGSSTKPFTSLHHFKQQTIKQQQRQQHAVITTTKIPFQKLLLFSQTSSNRSHPPHYSRKDDSEVQSSTSSNEYNDDAFGFVFLGGGAMSQDIYFAATYLSLSAVAAFLTNTGKLKSADDRLPAVVATFTLILLPIVHAFQNQSFTTTQIIMVPPTPVECAFCTISALVALFNHYRKQTNK